MPVDWLLLSHKIPTFMKVSISDLFSVSYISLGSWLRLISLQKTSMAVHSTPIISFFICCKVENTNSYESKSSAWLLEVYKVKIKENIYMR